ncbi:DMT family transporter [Micromonospora sp. NBC_01655]|uniref:DMT family transporter n=1 Tax=Micromonospora sp. NBC_01655 TaxID=2975983 RepID=UPI002259D897|nr:DMT family transporter [Micromonospora sp. NBC_01655]MCX4472150.1 DMT family transporter [Micromonospora sp. NBC_01655]
MTILAVACALAAASCFAVSTVMHQRAAKRQRRHAALDPRLLLRLLRTRLWRLGWAPDVAGAGLQALALRFGPLTLVQPLMASGLFLAILVEAGWSRRRVGRRDLLGATAGLLGLAVLLAAAEPRAGVPAPTAHAWWAVALGTGGVVAVALALSAVVAGATRGALLGLAAGILYGVAAALVKALAAGFHGDIGALLVDPLLPAAALVALAGLIINQSAYQSGRIAAPLTALTLADPVVSVVLGVTAFREAVTLGGPRIVVLALAVAAIVAGVWLAGTSPRSAASGGRVSPSTGGPPDP